MPFQTKVNNVNAVASPGEVVEGINSFYLSNPFITSDATIKTGDFVRIVDKKPKEVSGSLGTQPVIGIAIKDSYFSSVNQTITYPLGGDVRVCVEGVVAIVAPTEAKENQVVTIKNSDGVVTFYNTPADIPSTGYTNTSWVVWQGAPANGIAFVKSVKNLNITITSNPA